MGDTQTTSPKSPAGPDEDPVKVPALYDRFAERSRELFEQGQEQGREAWGKAMDLSRKQLAAAGELSGEQGEAFKLYMLRDLHQTAEDMRTLGTEARERFNPARLGAGALSSVAKLLHAAGGAAVALSNRAEESLVYQTGEITMAGSLTCSACGHKSQLKVTSVVPTCSECQGTRFRKSY